MGVGLPDTGRCIASVEKGKINELLINSGVETNARAEKLLDQNLETFGVDVSNVGNLNEKLTVLRESCRSAAMVFTAGQQSGPFPARSFRYI